MTQPQPIVPARPLTLTVQFYGPDYSEPFTRIDDPYDLRDAKLEVLSGCAVRLARMMHVPDASAAATAGQLDLITQVTWRPVWQDDTVVFTVFSDDEGDLLEDACDLWDAGMRTGSTPFIRERAADAPAVTVADREYGTDTPRYRTRP